jgi:hypothetical protein
MGPIFPVSLRYCVESLFCSSYVRVPEMTLKTNPLADNLAITSRKKTLAFSCATGLECLDNAFRTVVEDCSVSGNFC